MPDLFGFDPPEPQPSAKTPAWAIPECCSYRTLEEHQAMLLCWGLCGSIERGVAMNCEGCPLQLRDNLRDQRIEP